MPRATLLSVMRRLALVYVVNLERPGRACRPGGSPIGIRQAAIRGDPVQGGCRWCRPVPALLLSFRLVDSPSAVHTLGTYFSRFRRLVAPANR